MYCESGQKNILEIWKHGIKLRRRLLMRNMSYTFDVCIEDVGHLSKGCTGAHISLIRREATLQWYHLDLCKNVIGEAVYPVVEATNLYYGGADIADIYITNLLTLLK
ncbi:hypothetical protein Tco_0980442 [Tanacetum coccineum]